MRPYVAQTNRRVGYLLKLCHSQSSGQTRWEVPGKAESQCHTRISPMPV